MITSKFKKLFIVALLSSIFLSASLFAQSPADSSTPAKSYFKLSVTYLSNAVYYGRKDSLALPYISPSVSYHDKSGVYFEASLSYLASAGAGQIDEGSLTAGYGYNSKNEKLEGEVYASKYFYNKASYSVNAEIKSAIGNYLTYNTGIVSVTSMAEAFFSGKTDVNVNLGLSHSFDLSDNGNLSVAPAALANAGTQNFYENYYTKRKYSPIRRRRIATAKNVIIINKNFSILDYEISCPVYYDEPKWGLFAAPTFSIPVNPIKYTVNNGGTFITEKLSNTFYMEIGVYVKF